MNLVIVESPSKARTIEKYLGSEYSVLASIGHVRDLPKSNKSAVDIDAGFIPSYEITPGKEKVMREIATKAKKAQQVLLATDMDREGEAIAWHISEVLREKYGVKKEMKRIVFNEITKTAVTDAMNAPREIDQKLRMAQEARRVLDRLVGYDLSKIVWEKVRYGLSAGRVQSPALRIIMEREREIREFQSRKYWVMSGLFKKEGKEFELVCEQEIDDEKHLKRLTQLAETGSWKIVDRTTREERRSPRPPFTTSTMQQAASNVLGMSPSQTMRVAQKLYEAGHITYMRTDSTNLSAQFIGEVGSFIEKKYGAEYFSKNIFKTRNKNAQEAHEAIRPTSLSSAKLIGEGKKLYDLISVRAIASQMSDAQIARSKLSASIDGVGDFPKFSTTGAKVLFPGWLAIDTGTMSESEVPNLQIGDSIKLCELSSEEKETQPPGRYTEAGLIKELEKRGIGRPSTYASIMKTISDRGYVDRQGRTLYPTDTGDVVSTFLEKNFMEYINDSFTADMEDKLDMIALGNLEYKKTLSDFYIPFNKNILEKGKLIEKQTNLGSVQGDFPCPVCGGVMLWKLSKSGKFMSCEKFPECVGARKEDGTEMEGPKEIGKSCPKCADGKLVQREGRYGLFISCSNYPKCKHIEQSAEENERKKTGVNCPKCKDGEITERAGRFGIFYSCNNYPKCKYAIKSRPTGEKCKMCGELMMTGTKTIPDRCSDKGCPNHNPHKLKK